MGRQDTFKWIRITTRGAILIGLFFRLLSLTFRSNFFTVFSFLLLTSFSSGLFLGIIFILFLFLFSESSNFWYCWSQIMTLNSKRQLMMIFKIMIVLYNFWPSAEFGEVKRHAYASRDYLLQSLHWTKNWTPAYNTHRNEGFAKMSFQLRHFKIR